MRLKNLLNEMPASGKGGQKPYPINQWFMNTKQQLMSVVYWSQRQLPPSDIATYNREFIKIIKQLQQRHPAPEDRFQELMSQGKSTKFESKINEAPMDDRFAKEWEEQAKAFTNHIKHELQSAEGSDKAVLQKMHKNLLIVSGYPKLMGRIVGMNENKSMKLKDILNEAPIQRSKVDWSTMRLKSNIDQKWTDTSTMLYDLKQWLDGATSAMGAAAVKNLGFDLKELGTYYHKNAAKEAGEDPKQSYRPTNTADRDARRTSYTDRSSGGLYS